MNYQIMENGKDEYDKMINLDFEGNVDFFYQLLRHTMIYNDDYTGFSFKVEALH